MMLAMVAVSDGDERGPKVCVARMGLGWSAAGKRREIAYKADSEKTTLWYKRKRRVRGRKTKVEGYLSWLNNSSITRSRSADCKQGRGVRIRVDIMKMPSCSLLTSLLVHVIVSWPPYDVGLPMSSSSHQLKHL
jgi:hypothetical protein